MLLPHIHTSPSGFRDNAGFKETSFFGDEGRHRKPVLPGEVTEIRDGMPQHLGAFTWPASVSVEFATEKLKMVQELTCSGLLAVNICCVGLRQGDVIGRLVRYPSNIFTEHLLQARLELEAEGDLKQVKACP